MDRSIDQSSRLLNGTQHPLGHSDLSQCVIVKFHGEASRCQPVVYPLPEPRMVLEYHSYVFPSHCVEADWAPLPIISPSGCFSAIIAISITLSMAPLPFRPPKAAVPKLFMYLQFLCHYLLHQHSHCVRQGYRPLPFYYRMIFPRLRDHHHFHPPALLLNPHVFPGTSNLCHVLQYRLP